MKIIVDKNKCIGCNMCFDLSEEAIGTDFGKDGKAGVNPKADLSSEKAIEAVELAADACPMQAVKIEK